MVENIQIVSESGAEPITTSEAKSYLQIDFSDDDTLIDQLIKESRQFIEEYCRISLTVKSVRMDISGLVENDLHYYPITKSTIAMTDSSAGVITPTILGGGTSGKYYISFTGSDTETYSIAYNTTAYTGRDLKTACMLLIKSMYNNGTIEPEDVEGDTYKDAVRLLNPYRLL